jgi:hypothetical protein
VKSPLDPTLYILRREGQTLFLLDLVDDMLLVSSSRELVTLVKELLDSEFEMSDLGAAKKYLGWHIQRDRSARKMWLSLEKKITETVAAFGLSGSSSVSTPLPTDYQAFYAHEMDPDEPDRQPEPGSTARFSPRLHGLEHSRYRQLVGSLQYFAQALRPEIAYPANALAQVAHCPRERHWKAAQHCLRFLAGTPGLALCYHACGTRGLVGYSDSDYAGCAGTRRSTSGFVFLLAGSPVCWKSKKQDVITLSSCEAEYRALTFATTEALWLRDVLAELGHPVQGSVLLHCDNEAAVRIAKDPVNRARTKHAAVSFLFVRQEHARGSIHVVPVKSQEQVADYMTKPVSSRAFAECVRRAGQILAPAGSKGE